MSLTLIIKFTYLFVLLTGQFKWIRANKDDVPETEYIVRGPKEDSIYEFRIAAQNKAGVGPCSENTQPVKAEEKVGKNLISAFSVLHVAVHLTTALRNCPLQSVDFTQNKLSIVIYSLHSTYFLFNHFQLDEISFSVGKPPKVVTAMKDVTVTMPKKASLQCDISPGEPRATVRWFKDAKEVYPSRKYDMSYKVSLQHQNCFPYPSILIHFFLLLDNETLMRTELKLNY